MNLVQALYLNNAEKPFDDVRVRQALCYAIDRQQILDLAFDGYGTLLGSSMYPAFSKYFDDELTNYYTYNTEKAKELLTEAGYPNGFDMTITVPSNYQSHMDTAQVIVEQLKAVGINAAIQPVTWESWVQRHLFQPAVPVHCGGRGRFQHDRTGHAGAVRLYRQPTTLSTTTTRTMTLCSPRLRPAMTMRSRPPFTEQWRRTWRKTLPTSIFRTWQTSWQCGMVLRAPPSTPSMFWIFPLSTIRNK